MEQEFLTIQDDRLRNLLHFRRLVMANALHLNERLSRLEKDDFKD
jgi:hypothetical protein